MTQQLFSRRARTALTVLALAVGAGGVVPAQAMPVEQDWYRAPGVSNGRLDIRELRPDSSEQDMIIAKQLMVLQDQISKLNDELAAMKDNMKEMKASGN